MAQYTGSPKKTMNKPLKVFMGLCTNRRRQIKEVIKIYINGTMG
jgi:hypothetical protein